MTCPKCGTRPRAEFTVRRDGWGYLTARHRPCHMRVRLGVRYAAKQALKTGKGDRYEQQAVSRTATERASGCVS